MDSRTFDFGGREDKNLRTDKKHIRIGLISSFNGHDIFIPAILLPAHISLALKYVSILPLSSTSSYDNDNHN
jgi:hypothetical protein